jgi:predicted nucleic acid-binding protein
MPKANLKPNLKSKLKPLSLPNWWVAALALVTGLVLVTGLSMVYD